VKILAIEGENIASLARFRLDLRAEPLRSAGLFAITGPTGSGKSSLLDAMCLALFQRAPRLDSLPGQEAKISGAFGDLPQDNVRNLLRRGTATGWAACEFLGRDGIAYRARWGYRAAKQKGRSSQEELSLERLDDGQVLVSGNNRKGEFGERVEDLLGLTYAQFTRTVLLAQGRFAEFLRAPDGERARLLEKLTGTEIYAEISLAVFKRFREEEAGVRDLESRMAGIERLDAPARDELGARLALLESRLVPERAELELLTGIVGQLHAHGEEVASLGVLAGRMAELQADEARLCPELDDARVRRDAARAALEAAQAPLREAEALEQASGLLVERQRSLEDDLAVAEEAVANLERQQRSLAETRERAIRERDQDARWIETRERLRPVAAAWGQVRHLLEQAERLRGALAELQRERRELEVAVEGCDAPLAELESAIARLREGLAGLAPEEIPGLLRETRRGLDELAREGEHLRLVEEIERVDADLAEVAAGLEELEGRIPSARAAVATAREFVESSRLAASGNVVHLRSTLRDGEPCPVCGALEHALTSAADGRLAELLARNESALRAKELELATVERSVETLRERRRGAMAQRDRLLERRDALAFDPGPDASSSRVAVPARLEEIAASRAASEERLEALEAAQRDAALLAGKTEEAGTLGALRSRHRATLDAGTRRLAELEDEWRAAIDALDELFASPVWREKWELDPVRYLEGLERQVGEWKAALERLEARDREIGETKVREEAVATALVSARERSGQARERADAGSRQIESTKAARAGFFGGRGVSAVRGELEAASFDAETAHEQARGRAELVARETATTARETERLVDSKSARERRLREDVARIPSDRGLVWSPEATAEVLPAWEAVRTERVRELESLVRDHAHVQERLRADDEASRRQDEASRSLAERRLVLDRWARLSAEIGSSDGKKFSLVAQQFTLERLLGRAEQELARLSPRYGLRRLGDTMSFAVVDREAWDELRPVHTLSGGETFLVSLALALSLSSLSGSAVDVGTLFIDEGFGTLDGATLRQVMDALSNLQAQGRQVGLITHVEELKELIPVRVEVVRTGPGTSSIEVR